MAAHNAFLSVQNECCEKAAQCIHAMCVEIKIRSTHVRHSEHENLAHYDIVFESGSYVHYVRIISELKAKCGANEGIVIN